MIKQLIKIANSLDRKGLREEANCLDNIINKLSARMPSTYLEADAADDPSYVQELNPDWEWTDDWHDPNDEGYNDPEGLLETGEASRSLSDPDLLMEKLFDFVDSDDSGAIDPEEGTKLWNHLRSIIKELNPEATDEDIEAAVRSELSKETVDPDDLIPKQPDLEDFDF